MPAWKVGVTIALGLSLAAVPARAQEDEAASVPTAEEMIEVARKVWAASDPRCAQSTTEEIVVCAPDEDEQPRLESPTDRAIRLGERPRDSIPRAPDVFGLPPCKAYAFCSKVGRTPTAPLLIDLEALPYALTPEEAALVFRAEDMPPENRPPEADPATPAAASPAEAP